jgi:hypothetical protein
MQAQRFVVVTGSMRSGTSLIGHLLQKHPSGARAHEQIAFDNDESSFVADLFRRLRTNLGDDVGFGDTDRMVVLSHDLLDALVEPGPGPIEGRIAHLRALLVAEIIRLAPPGPEPRVIGLKRTSMNYEIGLVDALFDDVRLIFTVRDPRDVLLSHARRLKVAPDSPGGLLILAYVVSNQVMISRLQEAGRRPLVLQYETVVANPVAAMEDVLDHAGLDRDGYDFASLLSNNVPNNSSFGSGAGTGFVDGEGINTGSIGRFRSVLDARVGRFVDFLCSDINAAYGYEAISSRQDWEPQFADLLRALDKGCRRARISMAAVQNRLSAAGIDPRRFG